ncbi:unnamed protein product [Phytomonas sp. EM1]|nr:unnamed protein product [Phytomonas sp. EM1]|eukprot:CCW61919.1 unnamed protein product [Phytomonas sp. isolate EM1]
MHAKRNAEGHVEGVCDISMTSLQQPGVGFNSSDTSIRICGNHPLIAHASEEGGRSSEKKTLPSRGVRRMPHDWGKRALGTMCLNPAIVYVAMDLRLS